MLKGIRRVLELVLDRASADRTRREAQEALDKATDPKKVEQNTSKIDKAFASLRTRAIALGATLAAAFSLAAISRFGREAIRTFAEAEGVWSRLEGSLHNVGVAFSDVRGEIEAAARAMQNVTTVGDEDFAATLTTLTQISGDYSRSLQTVQVVADLAAAKQMDLQTAAQLVGRAMVGETATLKRYGIVVEEGADAVAVMREQFAGMAEREGKTMEGQMKRLTNEWGDFKEAVGAALVAAGGGTSILETLIASVRGLTAYIEANSEAISFWVGGGLKVAIGMLSGLTQTILVASNVVLGFGSALVAGVIRPFVWVVDGAALASRAMEKFWDVIGSEEKAARVAEQTRQLQGYADAMRRVSDQAQGFAQRRFDSAGNIIQNGLSAPAPIGGAPLGMGGGGAASGAGGAGQAAAQQTAEAYADALKLVWPQVVTPAMENVITASMPTMEKVAVDNAERYAAGMARVWIDSNQEMIYAAQNAAMGVMGAWADAFATIVTDGASMGEALEDIGRGMAGAMLGGLAQLAAAKVAENVARAIEALGIGLMGNPAGFAAAKVFGLAAAKWALLGSVAGAAQSAVSGGGRGGTSGGIPSGASDPAGRMIDRTQPPGPEIHIYMDPLSPNDPRFQTVALAAIQEAQEVHGEGRVTYHPASRR